MRTTIFATLGVASFIVLGCVDSPSVAPTDPDSQLQFAKGAATGPCSSSLSKLAKTELTLILARPHLRPAQDLWAAVENACDDTNPDAANAALFAYADYVRSLYPASVIAAPKSGTPESNFLGHLNTIFSYVGYAAPGLPGGTTGPLQAGIVAVIPATGGTREYQREHLGAFTLPEQNSSGDQRGHLFVMIDLGEECLSVDNLAEVDDCVELKAYPGVNPKFSPGIKVGLCMTEGLTGLALALGHETGNKTEIAGSDDYPVDCHASINILASSSSQNLWTRLATLGRKTFGVRRAYAADKGLGGIGSLLSPFGVVEASIFSTQFNSPHSVGSAPALTEGNFSFSSSATAPGSILVQNALGNLTGPLVVLSQGGGACSSCGGLELTLHLYSASGTPADDGVYEFNWKSVQTSPGVKGAPFVIRDGDSAVVATVAYVTNQSTNKILFNGDSVGTWTRNEYQSFKLVADLDTNVTSLYINGTLVASGAAFIGGGDSIRYFSAEFSGIDSGVMGWDDISVQRMSDQPSS